MRYVQLERVGLGAELPGRTVNLTARLDGIDSIDRLVAAGPAAWGQAAALAPTAPSVDSGAPRVPLARPSKVVCVGLNYRDHALEQGVELPAAPLTFAKFPSALIAATPKGASETS